MNRSRWTLLIAIIILVAAAILFRQYRFYRMPEISEPQISSIGEVMESDGVKHSVPLDQILGGGPPKDGIPSIDDPKFESVFAADQYLQDEGFGLAVEVDGVNRFYPYQILVWHEIVNDVVNDKPLLVTYCPLCVTGIVFEREVNGEPVEFGTSGKLWNSNLVMYDRKTDSYWSQALGEAIVGELTGTALTHFPSVTMRWDDFKKNFSRGEVLSRDTGAIRDYTRDPYGNYYDTQVVYFPLSNRDARLPLKEFVYGIRAGESRKAYPDAAIREAELVNDQVGDMPAVVFVDADLDAVKAFNREVNGRALTFSLDDDRLIDAETNSIWNFDGEAVSGELRGEELERLVTEPSYWFSWSSTFPETELFTP